MYDKGLQHVRLIDTITYLEYTLKTLKHNHNSSKYTLRYYKSLWYVAWTDTILYLETKTLHIYSLAQLWD